METNPLAADLDHILNHTRDLWGSFQGERLFITGGTGFFGCWLLESFTWAVHRLGLNSQVVVLTRDPQAFQQKAPHLANHPAVHLWQGDVCSFDFPDGYFKYVIHAATEASAKLIAVNPLLMLSTIVDGTKRTLEFAHECRTEDFLLTSSGAVYGTQPPALYRVTEEYLGGPNIMEASSAYSEGKRVAELLCANFASETMRTKIARCFAFVGPYLPLDIHFAIGNFIRDGLRGKEILVKGDGATYRSYLYAADLAIWLWTILIKGKNCYPYNVGSEHALTIRDLAHLVAAQFHPSPAVRILGKPLPSISPSRYVPSCKRARDELCLESWISLPDAIQRTIQWE
jgi:nucleoside-diphosphate-sugar epimerase